jgi:two-component system, OmpR family, sensor kinase
MSLRARLVIAYLVVVVVLGTAMFVVVHGQRAHLVGQVDKQLNAVRPFVRPDGPTGLPVIDPSGPNPSTTVPPPQGPISDLYVAEFDADGDLVVMLAGLLLTDAPDVDSGDVDDLPVDGERVIRTVDGVTGQSQFRVAFQAMPDGTSTVVALPLDEVDDAVQRLIVALALGVALVLLVMGLTMWWVIRLGLRPMARMTDAAGEIAAGRRERRVEYDDQRTEVGRLGRALNDMLDQRDRNEDKLRQFVADASHELRTPLTSIRGGLDLVLDEAMPSEKRDDVLRRARSESRRMHELVEDLLLLASLDSGRPLRADQVDLVPMVHDAADDARALQPGRTVLVEPTVEPSDPADAAAQLVVIGDEMRLRQVVAGLVHNALAHTPAAATLRISARREGDAVVLAVADDGPGLSPEHAATVFDRFTRGDPSRSRPTGGAGLGLAIARSIVEAHGGTLELTTAPGAGCTFSIRLH